MLKDQKQVVISERNSTESNVAHNGLVLVAIMDVLGNLVLTVGQFSVGSGVRQSMSGRLFVHPM